MKSLEYTKLKNIKSKFSADENNQFLKKILEALPIICKQHEELTNQQTELEKTKPSTDPKFTQRMFTRMTGKLNNIDIANVEYNKKKKSIEEKLAELRRLESDINKLMGPNVVNLYAFSATTDDVRKLLRNTLTRSKGGRKRIRYTSRRNRNTKQNNKRRKTFRRLSKICGVRKTQ